MGTQPKMQPDPADQLKQIFEDASLSSDFLAQYVRELELHRGEEDIFIRLAFENVSEGGGTYQGADLLRLSPRSELYEPLDAGRKLEMRRWWHEKMRREASQFGDLRERLSRLT